jgi:eukaryotic-like serine/threonine-protein kinase
VTLYASEVGAKSSDADAHTDSADQWDAADDTEPLTGSVSTASVDPIAVGEILAGRYELHHLIGQGGAGQVFKASDRELGEFVALKALRPELATDRRWRGRLVREVRVARAIRHPNVCRVFELGMDRGRRFITMELATGGTLRDTLTPRHGEDAITPSIEDPSIGALWSSRLQDARAVCAGLASLHAIGITHRDVTPQNVLRMGDGRLLLSDFGLALAERESTTFQGGTMAYLAPEVAAGASADQRADVWQLGLLLHHLVFGRAAQWDRRGAQLTLRRPAPLNVSAVVDQLVALCTACLSHDPDARPASAVEVAGRLAAAEAAKPRGPWTRAWLRARHIARRREVRIALVALAIAGSAIEAGRVATRQRLCQSGAARVGGVWDETQREAVRKAFVRSGRPRAAEAFATVARMIDDHLSRWVAAYTDACEATRIRGEQSDELLDLRMTCLNENLDDSRTLIRVLSESDASMVEHAAEAASTLEKLPRCASVRQLRDLPLPPKEPMARKAAEDLRREIGEAQSLFEVSQLSKSLVIAERVIKEAERIHYAPELADGLCIKGNILSQQGSLGAASILEEAVMVAQSCGDDRTSAEAATALVGTAPPPVAETWLAFAQATIRRLGGDEKLESWLRNNVGLLRGEEGRFDEAVSETRTAIALKKARLGPQSLDVGLSTVNLSIFLLTDGRPEEALAENDEGVSILERWLPPQSHIVGSALSGRGDILLARGRFQEAREQYDRALAMESDPTTAFDPRLAEPLLGLGQLALAENDLPSAIRRLERALSIFPKGNSPAPDVADAQFALARALDQVRPGSSRSIELAREAHNEYPPFPGFDKQRRKIDDWLATKDHRASGHGSSK